MAQEAEETKDYFDGPENNGRLEYTMSLQFFAKFKAKVEINRFYAAAITYANYIRFSMFGDQINL